MREREIKKRVGLVLRGEEISAVLESLRAMPPQGVITSLLAELYRTDERIKWNAVSAIGAVMDDLARADMEAARVVMRRILWNLNEESGGIGWGMPEAMGEIMAVNERLAAEYVHLLVSYMREENYLELPALQQGLLWGIGRMAMSRPELLLHYDADGYMSIYLESNDLAVVGLACRNFGLLGIQEAAFPIKSFINCTQALRLYEEYELRSTTVGVLARQALERIMTRQGAAA